MNNLRTYYILAGLMLIVEASDFQLGRYCIKPLLMLTLFIYYRAQANNTLVISYALLLSCVGDILLIFSVHPQAFLGGLSSFLLAHLCYIIKFYRDVFVQQLFKSNRQFWVNAVLVSTVIIIYSALLFNKLHKFLGDLQAAVVIYISVIAVMVLLAYLRKYAVSSLSYWLTASGATCFAISDSLLAINKFMFTSNILNVMVMFTYMLAQLLIIRGMLAE